MYFVWMFLLGINLLQKIEYLVYTHKLKVKVGVVSNLPISASFSSLSCLQTNMGSSLLWQTLKKSYNSRTIIGSNFCRWINCKNEHMVVVFLSKTVHQFRVGVLILNPIRTPSFTIISIWHGGILCHRFPKTKFTR